MNGRGYFYAAVLGAGLALLSAGHAYASSVEFGYTGDTGPAFWHELDLAFDSCAGISQSPIDVTHARKMHGRGSQPLDLDLHETAIELFNNGHTIEQEYRSGSTLRWDGATYDLLQFHFHTLSEHTVHGQRYPMELHAVFKDIVSGDLSVIAQFFVVGEEQNGFLARLAAHGLPAKKDDHVEDEEEINVGDALVETSSYYTYSGSLTTPPCSEIVNWIVLKWPATLSKDQYQQFREITGNNFRPLQELNGRDIWETAKRGVAQGK